MASQNDPHQQPQTPHQDNGDGDNKSGGQDSSTTTTTSDFDGRTSRHEGEGASQHNPASMSVDETTTGTDFFTLNGMKFDISDFDSKDNDHGAFNVQDFYHDGVFSCEDLYAVVNSSNPTLAVTEVESTSDWNSGSNITVSNPDPKQLSHGDSGSQTGNATSAATKDNGSGSTTSLGVGGMKIPASGGYPSNGSFYRLITLTNSLESVGAASMAYSEVDVNTSSSAIESNRVTSVPSGNTACNSSIENSQSPEVMASPAAGTKARKTRGRKPKHVKEAEAAAAAAAFAATASPTHSGAATSSPKRCLTQSIDLRDRFENQGDLALKPNIPHTTAFPYSASTQQHTVSTPRAPPNSPYLPQQHVPLHTSTGLESAVAAKTHGTQWSQSQPHMSLEQLASYDRRAILTTMRNQGISVAEKSHHHYPQQQQQASQNILLPPTFETNRAYPYPPHQQHRPLYSEQSTPPSPHERPSDSSVRANQHAKDPLDQLFTSRIAAPSNRSTVKPNIIQENRSIYNLLTTPTTKRHPHSSMEHLKLSQKRWMQYPNPSIFNESLAPSSIQQDATTSGISDHPPYPLPPPPPRVDPATVILGCGENVNIRRASEFNSDAVRHPHSHEYGSVYHRFTNQVQEINVRLDRLANGNYELKRQAQYLMKVNRHLMNRLRVEIEDNIELRDYKYQQSLELNGDSEFASDGRHGRNLREGGILSSYLEEELRRLKDNGFEGRPWEHSDEFLPVSGAESPSWPLEGISGERCLYRHRVPHFRRSSLLMGDYRLQDRDVMRERYFGNDGKRKADASGLSPQYANLRKRIRPDTLGMAVAKCDGKVHEEGEEAVGDDGKNIRNLEGGIFDAPSQPAAKVTEQVDISSVKLELCSPTRTNSTDRGSLSSVKSVATELVTPTDDSENTNSTVFSSPLKPGNFVHSTGPYFKAIDFESYHGHGRGDSVVVKSNITSVVGIGNNEMTRDNEYAATV